MMMMIFHHCHTTFPTLHCGF